MLNGFELLSQNLDGLVQTGSNEGLGSRPNPFFRAILPRFSEWHAAAGRLNPKNIPCEKRDPTNHRRRVQTSTGAAGPIALPLPALGRPNQELSRLDA